MSRLVNQRKNSPYNQQDCVPGEMSLDNVALCWTLEPGYQRPQLPGQDGAHPIIPAGTYTITTTTEGEVYTWMCNTLQRNANSPDQVNAYNAFVANGVPLLQNVPGRGGIEMHIGNYSKDTLGCTLIGDHIIDNGATNQLVESTVAYYLVYPVLLGYIKNDPDHTIDYLDPVEPV